MFGNITLQTSHKIFSKKEIIKIKGKIYQFNSRSELENLLK